MSEDYSSWVGRDETTCDVIEPARTNALRAALGFGPPLEIGALLPLLHHWLYFWNVVPFDSLGTDGHPAHGGFLPPVRLPRRMWAGGRLQFLRPLLIGEEITRLSTITKIEAKSGKSGELVFVTVEHRYTGSGGLALIEEQDIVYREAAAPVSIAAPTGEAATPNSQWHTKMFPDAVMLFRYSALTMNGHRIHYDRPYAANEEAYPGLVVHGPLQATLLAELASRNLTAPITSFDFRGQCPAFDGTPLHVCGESLETGKGATLWTQQGGTKNMVATAICGNSA